MTNQTIDGKRRDTQIPAVEAKSSATTHLHFVDKLRVAVVILVIAHHAAQAYGPTGGSWPIFNAERSALLGPFFTVNAALGMGLFFLVAAYFVPGSYDRKGAAGFLQGRFMRLGTPVLVFALFVFGPLAYFGQDEQISFTEFVRYLYGAAWTALYGHLWFLPHLIMYSTGYVLWCHFARRGMPPLAQTDVPLPTHRTILAFALALALVTWVVRIWYPIDRWVALLFVVPAEIAHLPQYISLFAIGILAYRGDWLRRLPTAISMTWLRIGLTAAVAFYMYDLVGTRFLPNIMASGGLDWRSLVFSAWEALVCVGLSMGWLTLFRERFAGQPGKLMSVMIGAAYGAYLIHVLEVVGLQMGLDAVTLPPFAKFVLVALVGTILSFGTSHLMQQLPGAKKIL